MSEAKAMLDELDELERSHQAKGYRKEEPPAVGYSFDQDDEEEEGDEHHDSSSCLSSDCEYSSDLSSYSLNYNLKKNENGEAKVEELKITEDDKKSGLFLSLEMVQMLRISTSEGNLLPKEIVDKMTPAAAAAPAQQVMRRHSGGETGPAANRRMVFALQTKSAMLSHAQHAGAEADIPRPKVTLISLLEARNIPYKTQKTTDVPHLFTQGCVASHTLELMNAIRHDDMAVLQNLWKQGHNFQSCNRFGESSVHSAARRGNLEILQFLKETGNVSLHCVCEQGRTPMHDACWTGRPDFGAICYLIQDFPESLYLTDNRGFTPLDFIPREAHEEWNEFLQQNAELFLPRSS